MDFSSQLKFLNTRPAYLSFDLVYLVTLSSNIITKNKITDHLLMFAVDLELQNKIYLLIFFMLLYKNIVRNLTSLI
jgi:hypothetical protein